MAEPVLKIVEPVDTQAACLQCGAVEHSPLFRMKKRHMVECDRCGFAYPVDTHTGTEAPMF